MSHSFGKQCCISQSAAVLELDILDVRLLEGQGALFILGPNASSSFVCYFFDMVTLIKYITDGHPRWFCSRDLALLKIINKIVSVGDSVRLLSLCMPCFKLGFR